MNLLEGKVAVITGAATGIGRAIAIGFHKQGAKIAINYLQGQESEIESLKLEINDLLAIPGDISQQLTSENLIQQTVQKFGEVNIFVSNAGVCQFAEFLEVTPDLYEQTVNINLNGAFYATQSAAKQMKLQGKGGSIIGVSSISALVGGGLQTHYTPTKAGILSLMQSTAVALGKYGIRCNALLPGTIRTQLNDEDMADDNKRSYMEGRIPLGRLGKTSDLAGPAIFLASDLSEYVTGSQILVDGGLFVNLQ
ncbi:short chain dehydrogenase, putative [Wickerhamomyces ciferrii]|uniref:Short chain dehydrogenase, putative n=1 Tax=Wickerhamomyces ciferrii (strain ATCC 14091 / BCRC 22168 / CBS 111 / JCM 3599 / NBRC 0793 / NRRL Y-1031 F-60-10) TaxID=1206466 RepID=K0KJT5_WICCF|nr:short chain dehydrogenase, putative [Wickerhamomyces ciferrii]CCH45525.1 short chain dehydrogenase, putative [Wickerhamomyces ciferrii]